MYRPVALAWGMGNALPCQSALALPIKAKRLPVASHGLPAAGCQLLAPAISVDVAPGNVMRVLMLCRAISTNCQPLASCTRMRPPAGDHHGRAAGSASVHENTAFPGCATF